MKFKRITAKTKLTFPCLAARATKGWSPYVSFVAYGLDDQSFVRANFTHWMPFKWPGRK